MILFTEILINLFILYRYMPEDARAYNNNAEECFKQEKFKDKDGEKLKYFEDFFPLLNNV